MAHTPAPWAYEPSSGAIYYADNDVEPVIAGINQDNTSEEQADEDGYLLAAAPEMLAALKGALPDYIGFIRQSGLDADKNTRVAAIRAAIAKAEGHANG